MKKHLYICLLGTILVLVLLGGVTAWAAPLEKAVISGNGVSYELDVGAIVEIAHDADITTLTLTHADTVTVTSASLDSVSLTKNGTTGDTITTYNLSGLVNAESHELIVILSDGNPYEYRIKRAASSTPNTLESLSVRSTNSSELISGFDKTQPNYSVTVPYADYSLSLNFRLTDSAASVLTTTDPSLEVTGENSTTPSVAFPASFDSAKIYIKVTPQSGEPNTYTIALERGPAPPTPNTLDSLAVYNSSSVKLDLDRTFHSDTTGYSVAVPYTEEELTVRFAPTDSEAEVVANARGGANITSPPLDGEAAVSFSAGIDEAYIDLTVHPQNGDPNTYTITLKRDPAPASTVNTLKTLTVNSTSGSRTLNPIFDSKHTAYNVTVPYADYDLSLYFERTDDKSKIELRVEGGVSLVNWSDISATFNFPTSASTGKIHIYVNPESGTAKQYTITLTRDTVSTSNTLSNLWLSSSSGSLSLNRTFQSGITSYSVTVPDGDNYVYPSFTLSNDGSTATVTASSALTVSNSSATGATVHFPTSANTGYLYITVSSPDDATSTYTITLTRDSYNDGDLTIRRLYVQDREDSSHRASSQVDMDRDFSASRTSYNITVDYDTDYLYLYPTLNSNNASLSVTGGRRVTDYWSSDDYFRVQLDTGSNTIRLTTKIGSRSMTYTLYVTRSSQVTRSASLDALTVRQSSSTSSTRYTLSPSFSYNVTNYTVHVPSNRSEAYLHLSTYSSGASLSVSNATHVSGDIYKVDLGSRSSRDVTIKVTYSGNSTSYKLTVYSGSNSELLSDLVVSSESSSSRNYTYSLLPKFDANENDYLVIIPYDSGLREVYVQATLEDKDDTLKVGGSTTSSGSWRSFSISPGDTRNIEIIVSNNRSNTYTLTVYAVPRNANNDASLYDLELRTGSSGNSTIDFNRNFSSGTTSYTASVGSGVDSVRVYPSANDKKALILVNGRYLDGSYETVDLSEGRNTISVQVYAENGTTTKSYELTITRDESSSDRDTTLSGLQVRTSDGLSLSLIPSFSSTTTSYLVNVPGGYNTISFRATTTASSARVTLQGSSISSGDWTGGYGLSSGNNPFTFVVTAANGSTRTYSVVVQRGISVSVSNQGLRVNGASVSSASYNINGNNYFKLRDIAYALRGTSKHIEVTYNDATRVVAITSGRDYSPIGGEMLQPSSYRNAILSNQSITYNGSGVNISAYNIDGHNYFLLRDIGALLDCEISYDATNRTMIVNTDSSYQNSQ